MSDEDEFMAAQIVRVSPEAVAYAREFAEAIGSVRGGSQIVTFDWANSMIEQMPGKPDTEHGPCLILGAYRRPEVPVAALDFADGLEFAVKIPSDVLAQYPLKRIDRDDSRIFRLALI